jgi:hypothetical protein
MLDKNVVHAFPAGTIRPRTVNQNNVPNGMRLVCAESAKQANSITGMQRG